MTPWGPHPVALLFVWPAAVAHEAWCLMEDTESILSRLPGLEKLPHPVVEKQKFLCIRKHKLDHELTPAVQHC